MGEIAIRSFVATEGAGDLDRLLDLYLAVADEAEGRAALSYPLRPPDRGALEAWVLEQACWCALATAAGDVPVGFQLATMDPLEGATLWGAGVTASHRRQGIGRRLVEAALAAAAAAGYRAVDSLVFSDNAARLRLLIGLGFEPTEIRHRVRADGGDLVRLTRRLP